MTAALRTLLMAVGAALVAGLALHGLGSAQGDRVITTALVALVVIPVVNVGVALGQEISRRHWGFALAAAAILAELALVMAR